MAAAVDQGGVAGRNAGSDNQNMISNLPLLFANGYPISLEKISESQLEKFIPFMVLCSMGNVHKTSVNSEPEWWPDDIPFSIPLHKPKNFEGEWLSKLKEIVCMCYEFHNNVFLLRFCKVLSSYEPACLRFINNYNSTTSLYDRFNNKLLVTFRNENMLYDQQHSQNRICLLPRRSGGGLGGSGGETSEAAGQHLMVEPPLFDIYLCDHCDAELYSLEAYREHEQTCRESEDDDVIICEPAPEDLVTSTTTNATIGGGRSKRRKRKKVRRENLKRRKVGHSEDEKNSHKSIEEEYAKERDEGECKTNDQDKMRQFLLNFHLDSVSSIKEHKNKTSVVPEKRYPEPVRSPVKLVLSRNTVSTRSGFINTTILSPIRTDRRKKADRNCLTLNRCPTIPLSSPFGTMLIKKQKTLIGEEYLLERQERVERFCLAPILTENLPRPKWLSAANSSDQNPFPVTYRKVEHHSSASTLATGEQGKETDKETGAASAISFQDDPDHCHVYKFPRRQFWTTSREKNFLLLNSVLLRQCRPCSVQLTRMTDQDIHLYYLNVIIKRKQKELQDLWEADMMREQMNQKSVDAFIDLCSSDEEKDDDKIGGTKGVKDPLSQRQSRIECNGSFIPKCLTETTTTTVSRDYGGNFLTVPLHENENEKTGGSDVGQAAAPKSFPYSPISVPKPLSPSAQDFYANVVNNNNADFRCPPTPAQEFLNCLKETAKSKMLKNPSDPPPRPSSILFLTKQQVRYTHRKVSEGRRISDQSKDSREGETTPVSSTTITTTTTTSSLNVNDQQIFDQKKVPSLSKVTSTTTTTSTKAIELRVRRAASLGQAQLHNNNNGAEEAVTAAARRQLIALEKSTAFPAKKIPSLIRISTVSGK